MTRSRSFRLAFLLGVVSVAASTGCESAFVTDAARGSLSSFLIDVFSTAVNESVSPDD